MGLGELDVGLADAIEQVRAELEDAISRGAQSAVAFEAGPVEMEFDVVFGAIAEANTGFRAWVVNIGGRGEVNRTASTRLKIVLQPVQRETRAKALIGDVGTE